MSKNRYAKGKIYKLVNDVNGDFYIGSTCLTLAARIHSHKMNAIRKPANVHQYFNNIGWNMVKIILVETYPCESKDELLKRERYWYDTLKPTLNTQIPARGRQEYYQDNQGKIIQKSKQYYEANHDEIRVKAKEHYEANKIEILAKQHQYASVKVGCPHCSLEVRRDCLSKHIRRKHPQP